MNTKSPDDALVKNKPIPLRLTQSELDVADDVSTQYGLSKSDLARRAYRAGLPIVQAQLGAD